MPDGGHRRLAEKTVPVKGVVVRRFRAMQLVGDKDGAALGPAYSVGDFTKGKLMAGVVQRVGTSLGCAVHKGRERITVQVKNRET